MTIGEKLAFLQEKCKCTIYLMFNPHKSCYESLEDYIEHDYQDKVSEIDYSKDIWTIQIYPDNPVEFYSGVSNNLDELLDWSVSYFMEGTK